MLKQLTKNKIGPLPIWLYVLLAVLTLVTMLTGNLPVNAISGLAVMATFGYLFHTIGAHIPVLNHFGGATLLAMLVPAALVYFGLVSDTTLAAVEFTFEEAGLSDFFLLTIITGSINRISKSQLTKGLGRVIAPLLGGLFLGILLALVLAGILGESPAITYFGQLAPALSGGMAPGVLPLAQGYSSIFSLDYGQVISYIAPAIIVSNIIATLFGAGLDALGRKKPELTSNGYLLDTDDDAPEIQHDLLDFSEAIIYIVSLYLFSYLFSQWTRLPLAVVALIITFILKVFDVIPEDIVSSTVYLQNRLGTLLSPAVLAAIGFLYIDLTAVGNVMSWSYVLILVALNLGIVLGAFLMSRFSKTYPIDTAIVALNMAVMGAMGNISLLSTTDRHKLMPFAQVATRIGGAFNIVIALLLASYVAG